MASVSVQYRSFPGGAGLTKTKSGSYIAPGGDLSVDTNAYTARVVILVAGNFFLLGAPFGIEAFCDKYTQEERLDKATQCLDAIGSLSDAQTALLFLRSCAGFAKFPFATRVTPTGVCRRLGRV